ncbi:hypothetical protein AURDEDRAFT_120990 [Auricularia subglabra TFB-10046 SS5]|nr:hypothetical protein AURDEDRAFT_120990 [Auricularia subglabra TFB-10046 SS5]
MSRRSSAGKSRGRRSTTAGVAKPASAAESSPNNREVAELLEGEMRYGAPEETKDQRKGRQKLAAMPPSSCWQRLMEVAVVDDDSQDGDYSGTGLSEGARATRSTARKSRMVAPLAVDATEQDSPTDDSVPPSPTETLHPLTEMRQETEPDSGSAVTASASGAAPSPMSASPSLVIQPGGFRNISNHAELARAPLSIWEKTFFAVVMCPLGFTVVEQLIREGLVKFGNLRAVSRESAGRLVVLNRLLDERIVPLEHSAVMGLRCAVQYGTEIAAFGLAFALFKMWRGRRGPRAVAVTG